MHLKPIKSQKDYQLFLGWADDLMEKKVKPNSTEGETLQVILILIKAYEDKNYQIPLPNPIEAIKLKMNEKGLKNKDLVGKVGTKGYVSAILNGRKPITLELAKKFHRELGISAEIFLSE